MVEFITPTKKLEVEPTSLEFRDLNTGIVFYPDGTLLICWGQDDDYDERKINIFNEETYYKVWNFIYENCGSTQTTKGVKE